MTQTCKYFWGDETCKNSVLIVNRQMCSGHYARWSKIQSGRMDINLNDINLNKSGRKCEATVDGGLCGRISKAKGLCNGHYQRYRNNASFEEMDKPFKVIDSSRGCKATTNGKPSSVTVIRASGR